jgi:beta-galactosidase
LNRLWGLAYWGQLVDNWDEFPPRDGILNPGYKLAWERFQHSIVTDFLAGQARIVREYARPDQFVTHDFVGGLRTNLDQWEVSRHLDTAAVNIYHPVQDRFDGLSIALGGDLARSLKQRPYFVMETNAQSIGWDSRVQQPPYDNQLRLAAFAHVASGASLVAYWHWHSLHYGQETYWRGVLGHDLAPNRAYREVSRIGAELKRLGATLAPLNKQNRVAILFSSDSHHALQYMPFSDREDYLTLLHQMYAALFRLNVEADFITPETADWSPYSVLLVPPLYSASDAILKKLAAWVHNGGHAVVAFKAGFTDQHSTVRPVRAPGPLAAAAGFTYQEFSSLAEPLELQPDLFQLTSRNRASVWAEFLETTTARPLLHYRHPFFGRYPAVTLNQYGKGSLLYEGTVLSAELQQALIAATLHRAGLPAAERALPVRVRHGVTAQGRRLHFYLNFSPAAVSLPYHYAAGEELLSAKSVARNGVLALAAWGVAIVAEPLSTPH